MAPVVEHLGYTRYWLGEHHGSADQSGSPEVLTGIVAAITSRLRVGPAGVLLRYYSPYKVAQSHRVLDAVYHPRIDLGVARGAGGDDAIAGALLDGRPTSTERYEAQVRELARLVRQPAPDGPDALLRTVGTERPLADFWVLGATTRSARLAGELGAAFGYSEYFAQMVDPAVDGPAIVRTYREAFQPSAGLSRPCWNIAIAGLAVAGDAGAADVQPIAGPPPFVGGVAAWRDRLQRVSDGYETDEIIHFDLATRLADRRRSLELVAEAGDLAVVS